MIAVKHLNEIGESELCRILKKGIHDYQNPLYNDEYPEEWMKADFLNNKNLSDSVLMNRAREALCDYPIKSP